MCELARKGAKTQRKKRIMGTDYRGRENEIASVIVDCCYQIHVKLGPGLLESVYEEVLFFELKSRGLFVERKKHCQLFGRMLK